MQGRDLTQRNAYFHANVVHGSSCYRGFRTSKDSSSISGVSQP